ncbi:MAG TPA: MscL family protein [Candidatus Bathyarchaeia archaeon]|nr:MscL family protein [Candidatus Bathyarchaeia archaeon]
MTISDKDQIEESPFKTTDEAILAELKAIKELLSPKEEEKLPEVIKKKRFHRVRSFGTEFILFVRKYKVLGLAVAFIMATYIGLLVQSLVNDIIMPVFQYIPGLKNLDSLADWQVGPFFIGSFISTIIIFIIISFVLFLIVKIGSKLGLDKD